jgi:hypothetical protein
MTREVVAGCIDLRETDRTAVGNIHVVSADDECKLIRLKPQENETIGADVSSEQGCTTTTGHSLAGSDFLYHRQQSSLCRLLWPRMSPAGAPGWKSIAIRSRLDSCLSRDDTIFIRPAPNIFSPVLSCSWVNSRALLSTPEMFAIIRRILPEPRRLPSPIRRYGD